MESLKNWLSITANSWLSSMEKRGWFALPIISSFFVVLLVFKPYACFPTSTLKPKARGCDPFCLSKTNSYRGLWFRPFLSSNLFSLNVLRKKVIVGTQSSRKLLMSGFKREKTAHRSLPEGEESQLFPRIIRKVSSEGIFPTREKTMPSLSF